MACINVCPNNAITIVEDEVGYFFPSINQNECVNCGLCIKTCPSTTPTELHYPEKRFVGFTCDRNEQFASTSGGIATAVCRYVIHHGGVAYGCTAMDYRDVHHIRIVNEDDLNLLRGSKYVQSRIGLIFQQIREDLKYRKVAFVGCPCQVAGLNNYLRKPYDNLITMDFVCHGVPCNTILTEAVKSYKVEDKAQSVAFRKKEKNGNTVYGLFVKDDQGNMIVDKPFPQDPYITGFLSAMFYRPSCYSCQYAQIKRCSDLTLGDYKEGKLKTSLSAQKRYGISVILANTPKGITLLQEMAKDLQIEEQKGDFIAGGQLNHPMPRHSLYEAFQKEFVEFGYQAAANNLLTPEMKKHKRNIRICRIRDFIYKFPFMERFYHYLIQRPDHE